MKIAVLISGRISNNYENIIKNIEYNSDDEIDFFISYPKDTDELIVQDVIKIYEPKKILRSNEQIYNLEQINNTQININGKIYNKNFWTIPNNVLFMYYSRLNLYNIFNQYLNDKNIKYDILISTRMDLIYKEKINLTSLLSYIDKNYICIPNHSDHTGINDQFAIGNINVINKYLCVYNKIIDLLDSNVLFHPETLLLNYIQKNNIDVHRFSLIYDIVR